MQNCNKCEIQISKFMCLKCQLSMILENEVCKYKSIGKNSKICQTPYYETMDKNCNLCPIENCLYCFEYLQDDYKQNTLFNQDQFSKIDKQVLVGCAQCLDGFIYDFTIGLCIYKEPIIQNCLRSFINQQGTELCTLSTEDDFTMAPELYDCQKLILNCRQCLQTLDSILKCIICEEGYATSISSGLCINFQAKNNEKHIVLWHDFNFWKISVQSFSILFMNTNPINLSNLSQFYTYPIECLSGYSIIQKECIKYCNNICQDCLKLEMLGEFKCTQCSENDYY